MDKSHYVYIHFKADTLEPFYIGKGSNRRLHARNGRSIYWKRLVAKHGVVADYLAYFDDHESALAYEVEMIALFTAEGFRLCNLTSGGEGATGYKRSDATNELAAYKNRGQKRTTEERKRISEAHKNYQGDTKIRMTTGREGRGNPAYKGDIQATHMITGATIVMHGVKDLQQRGFSNACVYRCISGEHKQHKGYTFKRILE
jgi:hypothetical protein